VAGPVTATARGDLEIAGPDGSALRFPELASILAVLERRGVHQ
jgi:hypothetical protein